MMKSVLKWSMFFVIIGLISSCGKGNHEPLQTYQNSPIPNGEMLEYGKYVGGEKLVDVRIVSIVTNNEIHQYLEAVKVDSTNVFHDNYTDFSSYKSISLDSGSLIELSYDTHEFTNNADNLKTKDPSRFKGEFSRHYILTDNTMKMEYKLWNGTEVKNMIIRENVKPGYPVFDIDTMMTFSMRILDVSKPGIFYVILPAIIKDPIPGHFSIKGEEKVKTPFGEIDALKLGVQISDPFLGQLMDSYSKDTILWVAKSDTKVLLKMEAGGVKMELEKVSNVFK